MTQIETEKLAKYLARGVFKIGDVPDHKTSRIAFKARCCKHGVEADNGGLCETALASVLAQLLTDFQNGK